ncbi:hypothetical protein [Limnohabitans sp.]|jgi:hypothetical protein|uniref:hypothetical protein n=1 Tax=Limnohabitans sp. TaxID=1907725 RepID=UPI00391B3C33
MNMRSWKSRVIITGLCAFGASVAVRAAPLCAPLPVSLQEIGVGFINQNAELQRLDAQLEGYLQPCLQTPDARNTPAICAHGRVVAEQVLRVVARIDAAGKHNAFLANAKMKSYKTGVTLLDRMKRMSADRICP